MMVVGAMKLFAYEKFKAQSEKNGPAGIPRGLATFIFLLAVFAVFGRFRIGGKQGAKCCPRGNAKDRGRSFEEFRLEPPG